MLVVLGEDVLILLNLVCVPHSVGALLDSKQNLHMHTVLPVQCGEGHSARGRLLPCDNAAPSMLVT